MFGVIEKTSANSEFTVSVPENAVGIAGWVVLHGSTKLLAFEPVSDSQWAVEHVPEGGAEVTVRVVYAGRNDFELKIFRGDETASCDPQFELTGGGGRCSHGLAGLGPSLSGREWQSYGQSARASAIGLRARDGRRISCTFDEDCWQIDTGDAFGPFCQRVTAAHPRLAPTLGQRGAVWMRRRQQLLPDEKAALSYAFCRQVKR